MRNKSERSGQVKIDLSDADRWSFSLDRDKERVREERISCQV